MNGFILGLFFVIMSSGVLAHDAFPGLLKVGSSSLQLIGTGTRKASIMQVKVYDAALYAEHKSENYLDFSKSGVELIQMHFNRDVSASDSRKVWADSLQKSCDQPCSTDWSEFLKAVVDIKADQTHRYTFYPDHVVVEQGSTTKDFKEKGLSLLLLKTWIGEHPPTQELKTGLLGRSKK